MQSKTGLKTLEKNYNNKTTKKQTCAVEFKLSVQFFLLAYFALLINNNLSYLKVFLIKMSRYNKKGSAILFDTLKQKLKRQTIQEKCMKRPRKINEEFYIWQSFIWDFVSEENIESHRSLHSIRLHILGL